VWSLNLVVGDEDETYVLEVADALLRLNGPRGTGARKQGG